MGNSPAKIETISKTISENVQQSVNSTIVNLVSSTSMVSSGSQVIDISGIACAGSINFNNISQKAVNKYNLSKINNSQAYQSIRSGIENGIYNALNSDTSVKKGALSLASDMGVTNENEAISRTVNQITNSYSFSNFSNDVTNINNSQVISIKNLMNKTGDCNFNNISQSIVLEVLASQIAESVANNTAKLLSNSSTYQSTATKTDYTQTGVLQDFFNGLSSVFGSISGFFWIILIVVFAAIFGLGYLIYGLIFSEDDPKVSQEQTLQ